MVKKSLVVGLLLHSFSIQANGPAATMLATLSEDLGAVACWMRMVEHSQAGTLRDYLNQPDFLGEFPLHQAIDSKNWSSVLVLLHWGANPHLRGRDRRDAYQRAQDLDEALRFQLMVLKSRGETFDAIKKEFLSLHISDPQIEKFIAQPPERWSMLREVVYQQALAAGKTRLLQYLLEMKGQPLPSVSTTPVAWDDRADNYLLWAIAIMAEDGGKFFDYLLTTALPVLPDYSLGSGKGVLSLFVGRTSELLPPSLQTPKPFNRRKFEALLQRGASPAKDRWLMSDLLTRPEAFAAEWQVLLETDYPAKRELVEQLPNLFSACFHLTSTSAANFRRSQAILEAFGTRVRR